MSSEATALQQLQERLERLEGQQARLTNDVAAHQRHADTALEDVVAALEALRARIDALPPGADPGE